MNRKTDTVVTRMAPSPTGHLHIGSVRTGLFNYLFARHHAGEFILRIEDTDKERSKQEYEKGIVDGFAWLGITADRSYRQSEHLARHKELLLPLIEKDIAYVSKEPAKDGSGRTVEVVRIRNPGTTLTFNDLVRGDVTFDTTELGDFVIARSIDDPLYHLAVVIDDYDEGVTHVLRAEEHISNTPRQILLHRALGFDPPEYAHIPLILAPDRSKLSKRKGSVALDEYRNNGYLPEAIVNYLALLGWNPGTEQEIFTLDELAHTFTLDGIQKAGAVFDITKLNWFNATYLKALPRDRKMAFARELFAAHAPRTLIAIMRSEDALEDLFERSATLGELKTRIEEGEYAFYEDAPDVTAALVLGPKSYDANTTKIHLKSVHDLVEQVSDNEYTKETIHEVLWPYAEEHGKGSVLWPMRVALSGMEKSPNPFLLAAALGKNETLERLKSALLVLEKQP